MHLQTVTICNFRGLKDLTLSLEPMTVLIGENNSGKTSLLQAIKCALTRSLARRFNVFEEYDYHLLSAGATPTTAEELAITLRFSERTVGEWAVELLQELGDIVVVDAGGLRKVTLHVTSRFDSEAKDFVTDWQFLDAADQPMVGDARRPGALTGLLQACPFFYLSAVRDATREFTDHGSLWGSFVRDPGVPAEARERIQAALRTVNTELLAAHAPLKSAELHIGKLKDVLPDGQADSVTVQAVPGQIADLLAETQVSIAGAAGVQLPLAQQGAGAQSLSVVFLFEAFAKAFLARGKAKQPSPILAIEEPETHLHPGAIRAAWDAIASIHGQKLIATHSGDFVARTPLHSIRRFYRKGGVVRVGEVPAGLLTAEELSRVGFHVMASSGELLFARTWLLAEGETEFWIYRGIAELIGHRLDQLGVRIVNYQWSGLEPLLKVAAGLGIAWFVAPDGDTQGTQDAATARTFLSGAAEAEHLAVLPTRNMEVLLCERGYGGVYERHISAQKAATIAATKGAPGYWEQVIEAQDRFPKPLKAQEALAEMSKPGSAGVPAELAANLARAVKLAAL
jgi:putative ATP-dependent endonuclease of OLD family